MSDVDQHQESQGEESASKKEPRGLDAVALRELRRARKLFKDGESNPEADFAIATANVLATLDLAAAIREHKPASNGD